MLIVLFVGPAHGEPVISLTAVFHSHLGWDPAFYSADDERCIHAAMYLEGDGFDPLSTNANVDWDSSSLEMEYQQWAYDLDGTNYYFSSLRCSSSPLSLPEWETDYTFWVEGGPSKAHTKASGTFVDMNPPITSWDADSGILSWDGVGNADGYNVWFWDYDEDTCSFDVVDVRLLGPDTSCEILLEQPWSPISVQAFDVDNELVPLNQSQYFTIVNQGVQPCTDGDQDGYGIFPSPECDSSLIDCDDCDASVKPDADEICDDGIDNDCDGLIDNSDSDCPCLDNDADGYGDPANAGCTYPELDCSDSNLYVYPTNANTYCDCAEPNPQGTTEDYCDDDGIDNDCDGAVDECPGPCLQSAAASTLVASPVHGSSDLGKHLAYFLLPVGAVLGLMIWRRKR